MAINILTNPSTSAPVENDDWTYLYNQVTAGAVPQGSILTDWESTTAAPDLKQGAFIRYEGNIAQVQTENYTISGSVSAGVNYIALTLVGTTLTAAWVTDISDYSYDAAYGGMYNTDTARKLLLPDLCYLDGTEYNRGKGFAEGFDVYRLADGRAELAEVLDDLTVGGDVTTEGSVNIPFGKTLVTPEITGLGDGNQFNIASTGAGITGDYYLTIRAHTFGTTATQNEVYDLVSIYIEDGAISIWGTLRDGTFNYAVSYIARETSPDRIIFKDHGGTTLLTCEDGSDTEIDRVLKFMFVI